MDYTFFLKRELNYTNRYHLLFVARPKSTVEIIERSPTKQETVKVSQGCAQQDHFDAHVSKRRESV